LRELNAKLPAAARLHADEAAVVQERAMAINETVRKQGGTVDPSIYLEMHGRPRPMAIASV